MTDNVYRNVHEQRDDGDEIDGDELCQKSESRVFLMFRPAEPPFVNYGVLMLDYQYRPSSQTAKRARRQRGAGD